MSIVVENMRISTPGCRHHQTLHITTTTATITMSTNITAILPTIVTLMLPAYNIGIPIIPPHHQ
jgi:hypothetical protein